jgi:hypothetical protein
MCLLAHSGVKYILCCTFDLFFFVLCTLCFQFLWIVHFWLTLRYSLTFIYCTVHVYVVIHICDGKWSFWVETNRCRLFSSFVYICIAIGDPVIKMRWLRFNPATLLCLSPDLDFQRHMSCSSLCSVSSVKIRWEVNVRFALNFLFTIIHC